MLGDDVPTTVAPPTVEFRETVTTTGFKCLGKSPNKLNRLYITAQPISEKLCQAIENGTLDQKDLKVRAKQLSDEFGWDKSDISKIWFFKGTNVFVDGTQGISYLNEIKDHVGTAMDMVSRESVLCGEPLHGVRFTLCDAKIHPDTVHRNGSQIIPLARRLFCAAVLAAKLALVQPFYLAEIETEHEHIGGLYNFLSHRRGQVIEELPKPGTPFYVLRAHLPVAQSFGFSEDLRAFSSGRAFPSLMFSHWAAIADDPTQAGTSSNAYVMAVRKRKGMKDEIPTVEEYNDTL